MLIMLTPKVRRLLTNKYIGEIIGPFVIGFSTVLILSWIHQTLIALTSDTPRRNATLPETFTDKNGQVYLKRHGMQTEEDIYRLKTDKKYYGIRADAGNGFRRIIVDSSKDSLPSPPGEVWSWPRIEEEADPNKLVWVVTPTYRNPFQYAELTRVAQALYPARKFVRWLVCDDHTKSSGHPTHIKDLRRLLLQFNIKFTLITSTARPKKERIMFNPKGVEGRRVALEFIRRRKLQGTVYFADDDNTYDSDIFRQIQDTKTISTWPTGLITDWAVSSPIVNAEGTVVDFFDSFRSRKFPVDFASFAINCSLLHANKKANIPWVQGYEETYFLQKLGIPLSGFQPLAANATEVLTWHTKTLKFRSQKKFDIVLQELSNWPSTAQNLIKKYTILFNTSSWDLFNMAKWKKPETKKTKLTENTETESESLTNSPGMEMTPISLNLMEPVTLGMKINDIETQTMLNSNPSPSTVLPSLEVKPTVVGKMDDKPENILNDVTKSNIAAQITQTTRIHGIQDDIYKTEPIKKNKF